MGAVVPMPTGPDGRTRHARLTVARKEVERVDAARSEPSSETVDIGPQFRRTVRVNETITLAENRQGIAWSQRSHADSGPEQPGARDPQVAILAGARR